MKKILTLLFSVFTATGIMTAQTSDCTQFFPQSEGSVLETKTYNASNQLLNTMIYRVNSVRNSSINNNMEVGFTMMDSFDNVISTATINASCSDDLFSLRMVNKAYSPEVVKALTNNTELVGYFLDYPNTFNSDPLNFTSFGMDGGEFTIEDNSDRKERVNVRVYNRQVEKNERVITPARHDSFDAYKIIFDFDVTKDKQTTQYKGVEWYAPNYGIVRSETYDSNMNLLTRTELTTLREM